MGYVTGGRIPTTSPDYDSNLAGVLNSALGIEVDTVSGTIGIKEGTVVLNGASALAMLLPAAVAGLPSAGGDDGKVLVVISFSAFAHTVTTPQNKVSDGTSTTKDTATFAAHAGASFEYAAYNGMWHMLCLNAVTLTEV